MSDVIVGDDTVIVPPILLYVPFTVAEVPITHPEYTPDEVNLICAYVKLPDVTVEYQ